MIKNLVRGFVDGALSTLGIVIGASSGSASLVVAGALGGTLANGISNVLSALSAESMEKYEELRKVEEAMVSRGMRGSELERRMTRESTRGAVTDGVATIVGGALPILPYLFADRSLALPISIGTVLVTVFVMGLWLGRVSKRSILFSAVKMTVLAAVVAGLVYGIQLLIVPDGQ